MYMHPYYQAVSLLLRVSHPSQVVLPFPRWEPKEKPVKEDEVGPQVTHIYEVRACSTSLLTSPMMTKMRSFFWVVFAWLLLVRVQTVEMKRAEEEVWWVVT